MLDKGDADLSILFTTDAQLFADSDKYMMLEDDKGVLPAGNVIFISDQEGAPTRPGPTIEETIEKVQEGLTLEVMQELNARVDIDKEKPERRRRRVPAGGRSGRVVGRSLGTFAKAVETAAWKGAAVFQRPM